MFEESTLKILIIITQKSLKRKNANGPHKEKISKQAWSSMPGTLLLCPALHQTTREGVVPKMTELAPHRKHKVLGHVAASKTD